MLEKGGVDLEKGGMTPLTNYGIALDLANTIKVLIQIIRKASRKSDFFFHRVITKK